MGIPKTGPVVAIDGPAGTGKSSVTRRLARALGYVHVDTGALYRAVAILSLRCPDKAPEDIAKETHLSFKWDAKLDPCNRILANSEDVTDRIRTPEVSMVASRISALPGVRAALLGLQRRLGCSGKAILEGRDIGTVIFPDADVKFFLTASVEERAKRRLIELEAAGKDVPSSEEVRTQIEERDRADSTRASAPLKKAADAIEIDTSLMTLDQVVDLLAKKVREKLK